MVYARTYRMYRNIARVPRECFSLSECNTDFVVTVRTPTALSVFFSLFHVDRGIARLVSQPASNPASPFGGGVIRCIRCLSLLFLFKVFGLQAKASVFSFSFDAPGSDGAGKCGPPRQLPLRGLARRRGSSASATAATTASAARRRLPQIRYSKRWCGLPLDTNEL